MKSKDRPSFRWLLWSLALLGVSLDQISKYGVFHWLHPDAAAIERSNYGGEHSVIPGVFELMAQFEKTKDISLAEQNDLLRPPVNHGALFGLFGEHKHLANTAFAFISVVAAVAIAYWSLRRSTARDKPLCAALGLILAGTLGNLYDRIVFFGVRDFLHFHIQGHFEWPVFNVADCCLVCGAALLLYQALWARPAAKPLRLSAVGEGVLPPQMVEVK